MPDNEDLVSILIQLKPTGYDGFEGLIANLLEKLTGKRFYLAKGGFQAGKDLSNGNCIAVEYKRCTPGGRLNEREILGELVQAHQANPALDLWVLVTSTQPDIQLLEKLRRDAWSKGIEILVIESAGDNIGTLEALCAYGDDIVINFIANNLKRKAPPKEKIKNHLLNIKNNPLYEAKILFLKNELSKRYIGFEHWRLEQNKWLIEQLGSAQNSRCSFGQAIEVHGAESSNIKRKAPLEKLNNWIEQWRSGNKHIFILTGEEGDGKTWAVASWITENIKNEKKTHFLFLPLRSFPSTDIVEVLANAISRQQNTRDIDFWEKRILNWMNRPPSNDPLIVLVIDGINEYFDFDWVSILNKLGNENDCYYDRIAIILTSRTIYWKDRVSKLDHLKKDQWVLPPFNEEELSEALSKYSLTVYDFPTELHPLIRKPRYFELIAKYRGEMIESGDITVQRLIYEDIKDRIKNIRDQSFTDKDFEALIVELADKALQGNHLLKLGDFANVLPFVNAKREIIGQLITGGIFIKDEKVKNIFKLEPNRLAHGLGILLVEELRRISSNDPKIIEEGIARFLEPQPEMDFKTEIVGAAVFQVMINKDYKEPLRYQLLKYWSYSLNREWRYSDEFSAYFPCSPATYMKLSENALGYNTLDFEVYKSLKYTFIRWAREERFLELFKTKFEEWMGYVNIYGYFRHRNDDEEKLKGLVAEVAERLEQESITPGSFDFMGFKLILTVDEEKLRLSQLALNVVSYLDRSPFLGGIVKVVLAGSIMGYQSNSDKIKWLLRTNKTNLWPGLEKAVRELMKTDILVANQTAYHLLSFEGSSPAIRLRNSLPPNLFGINSHFKEYEKDPCNQFKKEHYYECLKRPDIKLRQLSSQIEYYALEPDLPVPKCFIERLINFGKKINPGILWKGGGYDTTEDYTLRQHEISLYAFCPEIIADITNAIIRDSRNRDIKDIRGHKLYINYLIFSKDEREIIRKVWEKFQGTGSIDLDNRSKWKEEKFFWLIFIESSAIEQLHLLMKRGQKIWLKADEFFKRLDTQCWEEVSDIIRKSNGKDLWKLLWFISKFPQHIPKSVLQKINEFINHSEKAVRAHALEIAYKSKDPELIKTFIQSKWKYSLKGEYWDSIENYWGSILFAEFGTMLSYEEIRDRIKPDIVSHAIYARGMKQVEIKKFTRDFVFGEREKDSKVERKSPGTSTNWCGYDCDNRLIIEVIKTNPLLIQQWIEPISPSSPETDKKIHDNNEFYKQLCSILFDISPLDGIQLFNRLKKVRGLSRFTYSDTKIEMLMYDLFRIEKCADAEKVWDEVLENCVNDIEILEISVVCHHVNNTKWYMKKADKYLSSDILYDKARGVNMLGFSCETKARNMLETLLKEIPDCWVQPVSETAKKRWNLNYWARTWYQRFIERRDEIKAWASFKLFMKCVDKRFWTWKGQVDKQYKKKDLFKKRETFFNFNEGDIQKSIEENEKKLKEEFLGSKIEKSICPWD